MLLNYIFLLGPGTQLQHSLGGFLPRPIACPLSPVTTPFIAGTNTSMGSVSLSALRVYRSCRAPLLAWSCLVKEFDMIIQCAAG